MCFLVSISVEVKTHLVTDSCQSLMWLFVYISALSPSGENLFSDKVTPQNLNMTLTPRLGPEFSFLTSKRLQNKIHFQRF